MAIGVTVFAVIIVNAAVCVCTAILLTCKRHTATLAELRQLPGLESLDLSRERSFIRLKPGGISIGHKVTCRRAVSALSPTPITRNEFLSKEIRNLSIPWFSVIMYLELAGQIKARMRVKLNISLHAKKADAHIAGLTQCILEQFQAIALALVIRVDAYGPECP